MEPPEGLAASWRSMCAAALLSAVPASHPPGRPDYGERARMQKDAPHRDIKAIQGAMDHVGQGWAPVWRALPSAISCVIAESRLHLGWCQDGPGCMVRFGARPSGQAAAVAAWVLPWAISASPHG